jgi:Ca-activated chloride channel family protein
MIALFGRPGWLVLLWLLPVALLALVFAERRRVARLSRIGDLPIIVPLAKTIGAAGRFWRLTLWLFTLTVLVLALARPQWGEEVEVVNLTGVSVMVVMDISQSMNAEDITPSRLERARLAVDDLLVAIGGENEIGLTLFAGTAFVRLPLTRDVNTARVFLEGVNTNVISLQGTAIADALRLAVESC